MNDLSKETVGKFSFSFGIMAVLVFVCAGTLHYWQGWVFLLVFIGSSAAVTVDVARRDPELLRRRLRGGPTAETSPVQRVIQSLAFAVMLAALAVPALDYRYGWSHVAWPFVVLGDLLVALGMLMVLFVFRTNTYAFAVIEVDPKHRVISNGLYAHVRHPMYAAALILFMGISPALGSWWGLFMVLPIKWILIWRLLDEERFLSKNLPGYEEYRQKVRYRLMPGVW